MNLLVQHTQIPNLPKQVSARKPAKRTSIFYVNDIHGQIPKMERLVSASDHAKLYAQQNNADFLKVCCGDTFIGKDEERNAVAAAYLNIADFDAQAIGNHEFDMPASKCGALLKDTKTAVLAMNLNFPDNQSDLAKKVMRSAVAESEDGEKYGLIGIQPPDLEKRIKNKEKQLEGITVDDEEQTLIELQQEVDKIKSKGINKIILLSHAGNDFEKRIATTVTGIDVILGGHSHDLIKGVEEQENLLYSPSGEPVVITQAGRDGNNYGILNLEFDENGVVSYVQNNVMDTNVCSPDMIMRKTVDNILGESPEIGELSYVDPLPGNITEENPWADLVSDAVRNNLDADIALINSANFRGSVDIGRVTERDVTSIFPFQNKLFKVKLNEKDLVDAIRQCGKTLSAPNHKPGIMQVSGLSYALDAAGNLLQLQYTDKQGNKSFIDINNPNPNHEYTAVYDEFLINGGDGLEMLKKDDSQIIERYDFDKDKVTIDYIKSLKQPFEVRKDGRIQIIK